MSKAKSPVKSVSVEHDYDSPEGVRAAVLAAKGGDGEAAETLARRLTWILSGEAPYSEAELDELIEVAESGWSTILNDKNCHPEDMFQYAVDILWDDEGALIPENAADASGWMLRAAELGHADAQLEVGRFYLDGVGLKQSDELAAEWFTKAASDKENADHAEFFLAELKKKSGKVAKKSAPAKSAKKAVSAKAAPVKKPAPAKKAVVSKVPAKKVAAVAKKPEAKKPAAKVVAKKAPVKKVPAKAAPAVKKAAPAKKVAPVAKKSAASQVKAPVAKKAAPAKKAVVSKAPVKKAAAPVAKKAAAPVAKKPAVKAAAKPVAKKAAAKPAAKAPAKKVAAKRK